MAANLAHASTRSPGPRFARVRAGMGPLVAIWGVLAGVLALAIVVKRSTGVPWYYVMGDPATTTGWPFWTGFVSNAGALLWAATATLYFAGARWWSADPARRPYLLASGLFVALLGVDDLFLLHDKALPDHAGIPQGAVLLAYAGLFAAYLVAFRRAILSSHPVLFAVAVACLGLSAGLDQLMDRLEVYPPGSGLVEDAAKLLGIGAWLACAWQTIAPPAELVAQGRRERMCATP